MNIKIKSESANNVEIILNEIKNITYLDQNNKLSYNTFQILQLEWMLQMLINFNKSLSNENQKIILRKSLKQLAIDKDYSKNNLIKQINVNYNNHFRKKENIYILLAAISINNLPIRKLKIGNCILRIHGQQYPKIFRASRNEILVKSKSKGENENYAKVSVKIIGKDYKDAYEIAIEILEVFRSLLCLLLNSTFEIRSAKNYSKPINKVTLAEILTLHHENGTCTDMDYFHFVQDFKETEVISFQGKKMPNFKNNFSNLIRQFNKCKPKHQRTIQKALNLYVNAYDESNKYICFLRAWTVLEILTDTDNNELVIKRCSSLFSQESKPLSKQVMECLRQYRNEYVHQGGINLDPIVACFNIHHYIFIMIINFNLKHAGLFKNIKEANLFRDNYNTDLNELKTRKLIIDKAILAKIRHTKK
jgi:hypothetical protein